MGLAIAVFEPMAKPEPKSTIKITSMMSERTCILSSIIRYALNGVTMGEFQITDCPARGRRLHSPKLCFGEKHVQRPLSWVRSHTCTSLISL